MGSSPSYEGSEVFEREQPKINSRKASNFKDSQMMAVNKQKKGEFEENPEQQNAVNEINPIEKTSIKMKEGKTQQIVIPNTQQAVQQAKPDPKTSYEEMAKSNIPKRIILNHNSQQEEQGLNQTPKRKQVKQASQQVRAKIHSTNRKHIDEEQHFQPVYEKNHRKLLRQKQHGQQFNQAPFQHPDPSHKRNIIYKPHKNGEIDYHQYDSAHIRHKAIQQIHEIDHKKPIMQRDAIYEHEKLYPKILKDNHLESSNNKRVNSKAKQTQNERKAIQQEKKEILRKINLYRKHKMHMNGSSNDNYDDAEEPEPKAQPAFKKYHKQDNELQKSMEVRTGRNQYHQNLQHSMNIRDGREFNQIKTQRKAVVQHQQEPIEQNPPKPNFLKNKINKYIDEPRNEEAMKVIQTTNKQLEEKSIDQIKNQKDFDVNQYEVDPQQLKTCRECGRKFHQNRIKKHEGICQRLAEEKREQFNAQDQRMISKEQKKFIKRGKITQQKIKQSKKSQNIPKWKAQSIALRAHIKMGMNSDYVPNSDQMEMMSQQHHIDVVNCQFCGRNFNKNAAKTHIPFCQSKYEQQLEKQKFQRHPKNKR